MTRRQLYGAKRESVDHHLNRKEENSQTTTLPPSGLNQKVDARLIITMRGLRSFAYGMLAVLLSVALNNAGLSPSAIGGLITVSLIGDFCGTYVIGIFADRWGRRRTLVILALLMAGTGLVFG